MALYTESDGWKKFAREQMQNSAQNLQQKQAGLDAAKNQKQQTTLESALSGLVNGLKERGSDILNTVKNIEKTKYGWIDEIIANHDLKNTQKEDSARRNEIAKKYGFNSYSEAINSDKAGDNFWNEIKASNEQTKSRLNKNTDAYRNSITDVTKVNTNEAKGQALNTIDSVLGLIPGVGGVVANVAGGGISGVGDEYKAAGREGRDVDWSNAGKNALIGAASGVAGSLGGKAVGKVAGKMGGSTVGKLVGSNLAQGTIGGASAGAVGGALGTALNGGTLEDALLAAKEGAKAGAIGGGTMASVMGLGGTALDKIRNRGTTAQTIEPIDAEIVQKNRIEAPTAERIPSTVEAVEPVNNRRGIEITDLDAGEQAINVRNGNKQSRGKYIDGVVKGKNLPEAQGKTFADLGEGENIVNAMANPKSMFGGDEGINFLLDPDVLPKNLRERVKAATAAYADEFGNPYAAYEQYGILGADALPKLDRQEYYYDHQGRLKNRGGVVTAEDIPKYMQSHLRNGENRSIYGTTDNESIMRDIFGDNMSKEDMYRLYDEIASIEPNRAKYTTDNAAGALAFDDNLRADIENYFVNDTYPTRKINIEGALAQTQPVDITDMTTNYRKSTIPARQYEQTAKTMPEAEIVTNRPTTAQIAPETVENGIATGWGEKNMTNAGKKRNIAQKIGKNLQETGQATIDNQVLGKLKGNTAEEMARKNSVQRLRELGYGPSDYDRAANNSEVINKFYDDSVKATKTPVEAPQLRNIANEIADDFRLSADNRADLDKVLNKMLDDAVTHDGKMTEYTMDRYTPADLEKIAKKLGIMEQNLTTTNQGGSKKQNRNLRPEVEEYARALGEARNRIRNEIVEMTEYNEPELIARMKNAGMNQKQIDYVTQDHTLRGIKSRTSLFEDARTMAQQMKSHGYKRSASNSTDIGTQVANEAGLSGLVNTVARVPAQAIGRAEKIVGKVISGVGDKIAGVSGEDAGKIAQGAKNLVGKAANAANNATANLNNESLANLSFAGMNSLGNQATQFANKQIGRQEANRAQNRVENAQAVANAQNEYDNALADYSAQEANYNAQMTQAQNQYATSQLDRIAAAMEMALNAGDITAYSQLADLYTQAAKIEELRNPTGTASGLNATQQKELNRMDTAANAIDELEKLYTNAGGGQGIVGGNIANLLGNVGINSDVASYNALSEGLINQIAAAVGKTDALNNEAEVKRALSLVPKITDTPQTAQTKLNTLREMLQTNRETMLTNYGA